MADYILVFSYTFDNKMLAALKNKPTHTAILVLLCAMPYLLIKFINNRRFFEDVIYLAQQLGIAILFGIAIFLGISGFCWIRDIIDSKWLAKIGPLELFKICNDATDELHTEICKLLSPEQDVDSTDESLFIGGHPVCFVYCYGLLSVSMLRYDKNFLQSNRFKELNTRVLQRMVDFAKEKYSSTDMDMELVETQLKKTKAKELQNLMLGIEFYQEQSTLNKADPLALLVEYISGRTSLNSSNNSRLLTAISHNILGRIDTLILKYRK